MSLTHGSHKLRELKCFTPKFLSDATSHQRCLLGTIARCPSTIKERITSICNLRSIVSHSRSKGLTSADRDCFLGRQSLLKILCFKKYLRDRKKRMSSRWSSLCIMELIIQIEFSVSTYWWTVF